MKVSAIIPVLEGHQAMIKIRAVEVIVSVVCSSDYDCFHLLKWKRVFKFDGVPCLDAFEMPRTHGFDQKLSVKEVMHYHVALLLIIYLSL